MTAKDFLNSQSITDANSVVDKNAHKYSRHDLIRFAEAYHNAKLKERRGKSLKEYPQLKNII